MSNIHSALKKEFQLERMILFSDAVFAIAITLLVIEIKVPEIERTELTEHRLLEALGHLLPKFFGFLISFMFIGIYWAVHHNLFGFVINYSAKLLRLNLIFLFAVALMPFSTAFYSEYLMRHLVTPVVFYTGNILLLGFINFLMWKHVANPVNQLSNNLDRTVARYYILRAIFIPIVFTLFAFLYLVQPLLAMLLPIIIPLVLRGMKRYYSRKTGIKLN